MAQTPTAGSRATPSGAGSTSGRLYKANSVFRATVIGVLVCDLGILFVSWNELTRADSTTLAVIAGVGIAISALGLLFAWLFGSRQIEVAADQLTLHRGSGSQLIRFADIVSLEKRKVGMGGSKYTAWFAVVKQGQATCPVQLVYEGQYREQDELLEVISQAAAKPWVEG